MRRSDRYTIGLGLLLLVLGCSQLEEIDKADEELIQVPVALNLLPAGMTTKAVIDNDPNGEVAASAVREVYVDRVKLLVYKREKGTYPNKEADFYLDESNQNIVLTCEPQTTFPYFIARGSINIKKNLEYRINAIGYSEAKEEGSLFTTTGSRFDHTELHLTDDEEYRTPEFFFGNVVTEAQDTVFSFASQKAVALTGWLYRGIAGIEVNLGNVKAESSIKKIELLADSIHTKVGIREYDDFVSPFTLMKDGTYQHYVIGVDSLADGQDRFAEDSVHIKYANVLPVCTSLSLRITKKDGTKSYATLRFKHISTYPDPSLRSIPEDAGNGTGIIPERPEYSDPETLDGDEDSPYRICFQRNNYYRIKGDYSKLSTMEYILTVTVNPNWEGDVNLPLERN